MAIIGTLALKLIISVLLVRLPCLPCFTFTKEPQSPIIVVLGHNTTNVNMEWKLNATQGSTLMFYKLKRFLKQKDNSLSKETSLVFFSPSLNKKKLNETLYGFSGSLAASGYANFTIKDVLKRVDNADKTEVSFLSGDVYTYRLDVDTITLTSQTVTEKSSIVVLQVYFPPTITGYVCQGCQNGSAVENQTITLLCNATGNPDPNITWRKDGKPYNGSSTVSKTDNKLVFHRIAIDDKGNYTCIANNGVGEDRKSKLLFVRWPPSFICSKTKILYPKGSEAVFNVNVEAYPKPTEMFVKSLSGEKINSSHVLLSNKNYSVWLYKVLVTIPQHYSPPYILYVKNDVGSRSHELDISRRTTEFYFNASVEIKNKSMDDLSRVDPVMQALLKEGYRCNPNISQAKIIGYKNGSLYMDFQLNVVDDMDDYLQPLRNAIRNNPSLLNGLAVNITKGFYIPKITTTPPSTTVTKLPKTTDPTSPMDLTMIIIIVIVAVVLVIMLILLIVWYCKKKKTNDKKPPLVKASDYADVKISMNHHKHNRHMDNEAGARNNEDFPRCLKNKKKKPDELQYAKLEEIQNGGVAKYNEWIYADIVGTLKASDNQSKDPFDSSSFYDNSQPLMTQIIY